MVLKFCGGLWDASRTDDDLDAAASRQRRLQELLREGSTRRHIAKFKKEVRVILDAKRPHGIEFVSDDGPESRGYGCCVASIDTTLQCQVAEYNARCKSVGDYAHVILEGMRVRCVDNDDMQGVAFEDVLYRIATGSAVTFADVSSPLMSSTPKLRAVGNVVLAAQRAQRSPRKVAVPAPTSPTSRRSASNANASPKVSKWSSVLTSVTESVKANQADVLASDLVHKNAHLEAQILIMKGKLGTLEREKAALEKQRDDVSRETTEKLEHEQAERREVESELEKTREQCAKVTQQNTTLSTTNASMRAELTTLQSTVEKLQQEYDTALLQLHELQVEHRDVQQHAEELHNRLVAAQLLKSELQEQITTIKREQSNDQAAALAIQAAVYHSSGHRPSVVASADDSPTIALLKQMLQSRDALDAQNDELRIELSCHETTIQNQQDQLIELEDKLTAVTQINDSLRSQVRTLITTEPPAPPLRVGNSSGNEQAIQDLERQLRAERSANAKIQSALQALEDKARAKLEHYEKEQLFLAQFKELLVKGIAVTKYGARGNPHPRILYSDAQCRWLSWRSPSDGSISPRADAKAETLDLVEVLMGATTETFAQMKPEIPARCFSLVFCRPCRTLDVEVETRDRAVFLSRGFRLLLERAAETRRQDAETASTE